MSTNLSVPNPSSPLIKEAESVKKASILLGQATNEKRREALTQIAKALNDKTDEILILC